MSSGEQEDFLVDSGDTGTDNALVEFDWDDGFAANLLQDCSSSTRRLDSGVDRDDDDSDEVLDCGVDTMLSMVHLEGASAGAVPDGQNERAGGEEESNDEQQSNNVVSTSTEDASILKKRRGPKKVAMWTDEDGSKRPCLPRQTFWYSQYVLHPDLGDPHFHKIFRLRFRLPYEQFVELNQ